MMIGLIENIPWLLIVVVLLLLFVVVFLLDRYVLFPFIINIFTSLSTEERIEILKKEDCLYKRHRFLKNKDLSKSPFDKRELFDRIFCLERQEFTQAVDLKTNHACYYWIKIKRYMMFFPFTSKEVFLEKETRTDVISSYKNWTDSAISIVGDTCPACGAFLHPDVVTCPDCNLEFV